MTPAKNLSPGLTFLKQLCFLRLYGVTMQKDGVSKVLKVQLKDAVHIAKEEK